MRRFKDDDDDWKLDGNKKIFATRWMVQKDKKERKKIKKKIEKILATIKIKRKRKKEKIIRFSLKGGGWSNGGRPSQPDRHQHWGRMEVYFQKVSKIKKIKIEK